MTEMVRLDRLAKRFGPVHAVDGVSFALREHEVLGLVGESGCGKSMTALAVMGLLPEAARVQGSIRFEGQELTTLDDAALCRLRGRRIGMTMQEHAIEHGYLGYKVAGNYITRRLA